VKILIACEFSGIVRDAFIRAGHDAMSCDLLPTEHPGPHYQGDVLDILSEGWDMMIAHPPCTDLAVSGAAWFKEKIADGRQQAALDFVRVLMSAPIEQIALENPISVISSKIRRPDQIIQPYQYGHPETKATCLWLKNLPLLVPTNIVSPVFIIGKDGKRYSPTHYYWQKKDRWKIRSTTFQGIANAMADQWSEVPVQQMLLAA
jgi:site-specific DNA-cytosine methylase